MENNEQVSYVVRWPSGYELEYDNIGHALDCFYEEVDDPDVANDDKPVCVLRRTITDEILT